MTTASQRTDRARFVQFAKKLRRKLSDKALCQRFNVCRKTIRADEMRPVMSSKDDVREITFVLFLDELFGEDVSQGDTTKDVRRDRARKLIVKNDAAFRPIAKSQNMSQAFESIYGEAL